MVAERYGYLHTAYDQITNLRTTLNRQGKERRKLSAILSDQRSQAAPELELHPAGLPRCSWWPW